MSGCVTVTGPPSAIWRSNSGETEPLEPSTLPKRTSEKRVPGAVGAKAWMKSSAARLVAPITLVGFTALSVEMKVKAFTPSSAAMVAQRRAPSTLVRIASFGILLHQRHVLQRGRVDHQIGRRFLHRLLEPHLVAHVADHHAADHVGIGARQVPGRSRRR